MAATLPFETRIGTCGVRWGSRGLTRVLLPGRWSARDGAVAPADAPPAIAEAVRDIVALFEGEPRDLRDVVLDLDGVDGFRRRVYAAARGIDPRCTATYGDLARAIGQPDAARAVGAALGSNPFPIVVPCHRILASTGALHGFSAPGGLATKRRMLELEGAPGFRQASLFA
jgi:methylated-DNA-[protein]-cysteine S-methyltransferase